MKSNDESCALKKLNILLALFFSFFFFYDFFCWHLMIKSVIQKKKKKRAWKRERERDWENMEEAQKYVWEGAIPLQGHQPKNFNTEVRMERYYFQYRLIFCTTSV